MHAGGGGVAGRPPEKRVGMQVMTGEEEGDDVVSFSTCEDKVCVLMPVSARTNRGNAPL